MEEDAGPPVVELCRKHGFGERITIQYDRTARLAISRQRNVQRYIHLQTGILLRRVANDG